MKRKPKGFFVYTYGTRIHEGREVDVFTAKPKKEGAKRCFYVVRTSWARAFNDLCEYWGLK